MFSFIQTRLWIGWLLADSQGPVCVVLMHNRASSSWVIPVGMMVETRNVVRLAPPTTRGGEATHAASAHEVVTAVSKPQRLESFFFLLCPSGWRRRNDGVLVGGEREKKRRFHWRDMSTDFIFGFVFPVWFDCSTGCRLLNAASAGQFRGRIIQIVTHSDWRVGFAFWLLWGQRSGFSGLSYRMHARVCRQTASVLRSLLSSQTSSYWSRLSVRVSVLTVNMERNLLVLYNFSTETQAWKGGRIIIIVFNCKIMPKM